jgi:AmpE protein
MNFIAFLLGLGLERVLAEQLKLREPGWLSAYVGSAVRQATRAGRLALPVVLAWVLLPGLVLALGFSRVQVRTHGMVDLLLGAVVLFFALGPRDLRQEVRDYRAALAGGEVAVAAGIAAEILDDDSGQRHGPRLGNVAEAVFVQANNRLFGVLFWFALLGPFGALAFRLSDLMRREAIARAAAPDAPAAAASTADLCQRVHGVLAFLPARLVALSYGIAGSFDESFTGWRGYLAAESDHFFDANDRLLVHAGRGALGGRWQSSRDEGERAGAAFALTEAAFYVWLAGFALLTLLAFVA